MEEPRKKKECVTRPRSLFISHGFQNIFSFYFFTFPLSNCWRSADICQTGLEFSHRWRTPYCRLSSHGWVSCVLLRFVLAIIGLPCCRIVCFSRWRSLGRVTHCFHTDWKPWRRVFILKWAPFVTLCLHTDIKTYGWEVLNTEWEIILLPFV